MADRMLTESERKQLKAVEVEMNVQATLDKIASGRTASLRESKSSESAGIPSDALMTEARNIIDGKPNSGADEKLLAEACGILGIKPGETTSGKTSAQLHDEALTLIR